MSPFGRSSERKESSDDSMSSGYENDLLVENKRKRVHKKKKREEHERAFACEHCGQRYFTETRLNRHIFDHGELLAFVHTYRDHYLNFSKIRILCRAGPNLDRLEKCGCCAMFFRTTDERDAHMYAEHSDSINCDRCNKTFRSAKSLEKHNYIMHKEHVPLKPKKVPELKCHICGKRYFIQKGLDMHIAEHGKRNGANVDTV